MSLRAPDWLPRLTGRRLPSADPGPEAEAALWSHFEALARANGMTPPPLEVEPDPRGIMCPVRIDWTEAEDRVLASSTLAGAGPHEQTWHLATALGWWASPGPRRRRNRGRVALVLGALPYCAFALADIFGAVELPKPAILFLGVAVAPASVHRRARTEPADRRCGTGRDDTRSLAVLRQRPSG